MHGNGLKKIEKHHDLKNEKKEDISPPECPYRQIVAMHGNRLKKKLRNITTLKIKK